MAQKTPTKKRTKEAVREALIPMALEVYKTDCKIKYTTYDNSVNRGEKRGDVMNLSDKSVARLVFIAQNTDIELKGMVTLTYPSKYPSDGKMIKDHLNTFLTWAKKVQGIGNYLWFLEFQKRGAPHFHILTENDITHAKRDVSRIWYGIVDSGDPRHLRVGTRTEKIRDVGGAGKYAAKYGAKKSQKAVPPEFRNVGRFWGASRGMTPVMRESIEIHDMKVIKDTLDGAGWEYCHLLNTEGLGTLYNAGKLLNQE